MYAQSFMKTVTTIMPDFPEKFEYQGTETTGNQSDSISILVEKTGCFRLQ